MNGDGWMYEWTERYMVNGWKKGEQNGGMDGWTDY